MTEELRKICGYYDLIYKCTHPLYEWENVIIRCNNVTCPFVNYIILDLGIDHLINFSENNRYSQAKDYLLI